MTQIIWWQRGVLQLQMFCYQMTADSTTNNILSYTQTSLLITIHDNK